MSEKTIFKFGWEAFGFKSYEEYIDSWYWKDKKIVIMEEFRIRNKLFCNNCKSKNNLQIHHINYNNCCNERFNDLILLCPKCHGEIHGR